MAEKVAETAREKAGVPGIQWESFLYSIFQNKWKMLGIFVLISGSVGVITYLRPAVYRSEARFLVRLGRESAVLDPTAITEQGRGAQSSSASEIYTALEIFRSQDIAAKVIDELGELAILEPIEYALARASAEGEAASIRSSWKWKAGVARAWRNARAAFRGDDKGIQYDRPRATAVLMRALHIRAIPSTNVISVVYESYHPLTAQAVLKALTQVYLKEHQSAYRNPSTMQFFADQVREWRSELRRTEDQLVKIHNESQTTSLQDSLEGASARLSEVDVQIGELEAKRRGTSAVLARLRERLRTSEAIAAERGSTALSFASAIQLQRRLDALREEEQILCSKYYDDSPPVKRVRRDIANVMEKLGPFNGPDETSPAHDPEIRAELELDLFRQEEALASTDARLAVLRERRARMLDHVRDINAAAAEARRLERSRERQEVNLRNYSDKYEQARTDTVLEREKISNILSIQTATYPTRPSRPRKKVMMAGGGLLGVLCGSGYAIVLAFLDKRLKLPAEVEERLGLPVLASIPQMSRQNALPSASGSRTGPTHPSADGQYEALCASLLRTDRKHQRLLKAIALSSIAGQEGTSTVAYNLGLKLSRMCDGRVLLVDANWMRPVLHEGFRQRKSPGLTDLFSDEAGAEEVIREVAAPGVDLLPIGSDPGALEGEPGARLIVKLNKRWLNQYRYVLYDLPALGGWRLGVHVAGAADACVLVLEAGKMVSRFALRWKEYLVRSGVNVAGVVLNRQNTPIPSWIYRYI